MIGNQLDFCSGISAKRMKINIAPPTNIGHVFSFAF
jgi:hypothetical protein